MASPASTKTGKKFATHCQAPGQAKFINEPPDNLKDRPAPYAARDNNFAMMKSADGNRRKKSSLSKRLLYVYLVIMCGFCFYPLTTGVFQIRTAFAYPMYQWHTRVAQTDIIINLLLYIPVGILLMVNMRKFARLSRAVTLSILVGTAISAGVEFVQYFITDRVSSSYDIFLNFVSTSIGVVLATIMEKLLNLHGGMAQLLRPVERRETTKEDGGLEVIPTVKNNSK